MLIAAFAQAAPTAAASAIYGIGLPRRQRALTTHYNGDLQDAP